MQAGKFYTVLINRPSISKMQALTGGKLRALVRTEIGRCGFTYTGDSVEPITATILWGLSILLH